MVFTKSFKPNSFSSHEPRALDLGKARINNILKGGTMTSNQIAYWTLEESKRHNQAGENELTRHNYASEQETVRHNLAGEQLDIANLAEQSRHNRATEEETRRANVASLAETNRHNVTTEYNAALQTLNDQKNAETQRMRAEIEQQKVDISALEQKETARHNQRVEVETMRHNVREENLTEARNNFTKTYNQAMVDINRLNAIGGVQINSAKVREINQQISKMQADIKIAQQKNEISAWDTATKSTKTIIDTVSKLISFAKK